MLFLRATAFMAAAGVAVYLTYGYFTYDREGELAALNASYLDGDYDRASKIAHDLYQAVPFAAYQKNKAYIARAQGLITVANQEIDAVLEGPLDLPYSDTVVELYLNRMFNAYLQGDQGKMRQLLGHTSPLLGDTKGWYSVFAALDAFDRKDYFQARKNALFSAKRGYFSPWMERDFSAYFGENWLTLFIAELDIQEGRLLEARQNLELISRAASNEELEKIAFLMGLSYVKEAAQVPLQSAAPFYRLAFNYFDRIPFSDDRYREFRESLSAKVAENLEGAILTRSYGDLPFYAALLERWSYGNGQEELQQRLAVLLEKEIAVGDRQHVEALAGTLSAIVENQGLREKLQSRFETLVDTSLESCLCEELETYWRICLLFSADPEELIGRYSAKTRERALTLIIMDNKELTRARPILDFWLAIENEADIRQYYVNRLLETAVELWNINKQREKAVAVMKWAKSVPLGRKTTTIQDRLEEQFQRIYARAKQYDNLNELNAVLHAANELELASLDLDNPLERAGYQDDARYQMSSGRYEEAEKKALYLLKLDPENLQAKEILGTIYYEQADYEKAYAYLKGLKSDKPDIQEAKGAAAVIAGDAAQGQEILEAVAAARPLKSETYLRIGFGLLTIDKPSEALPWLERGGQENDAAIAGTAYASFQLDSWEEALDNFEALEYPYDALDGLHGIAVESLLALGKEKQAEEMVEGLLKKPPEPGERNFPVYFQVFKQKKLDRWNRNFTAAIFYKVVKQDLSTALKYFNRIENPSPEAEIEKAEVLVGLNRQEEARNVLESVLLAAQGTSSGKEAVQRVYPLLGSIEAKLGYTYEALLNYEAFFTLNPEDFRYRADYARVLVDLKRCDRALAQYRLLEEDEALSLSDRVDYIKCLAFSDRFEEADNDAREWLSRAQVPLLQQLKLARVMVVTRNKEMLEHILFLVSEKEKRTIEESRELILLWMDLGNYKDAQSLANVLERDLSANAEGLLVLAKLYARLSETDKAIEYAERAATLSPSNIKVFDFLNRYERTPSEVLKTVLLLKDRIDIDPESLSLKIDYAKNLIELAIVSYTTGELEEIKQSRDLQQAKSLVEDILKQTQEIPLVYFLKGKVHYLLDEDAEAIEAYRAALAMDPAYLEALQYLALAYEGGDELDLAIEQVQTGIKFHPSSAESWMQLGRLQAGVNRLADAEEAFFQAAKYAPRSPEPYIQLAEVNLMQKNPEKAIFHAEKALLFEPKNMDAIKLMLRSLYDPRYSAVTDNPNELKKRQQQYFDKLQALDPAEAKAMREKLGVKE